MSAVLEPTKKNHTNKWPYLLGLIFYTTVIFALIVVTIYFSHLRDVKNALPIFSSTPNGRSVKCEDRCDIQIVESIPDGLDYPKGSPKFMSTYEAWSQLIDLANNSLEIGSMYWTMLGADVVNHSSAVDGEAIFSKLLAKGMKTNFQLRIANSAPKPNEMNDFNILLQHNAADIRFLNFTRLLGAGVLHTKLWIADNKHFYVGSANMDWRSLRQVKELGVFATNCSCLAQDLKKIFNAYWFLGVDNATIPVRWPIDYATECNKENPANIRYNNSFNMTTFLASSPPPLSAQGRTHDVDAVVDTILSARSFINIAVMDYFPLLIYTAKLSYWPVIDDALRKAAIENRVAIKMLISLWPSSRPSEDYFLKSLTVLSQSYEGVDIQVKRFIVPATDDQSKIPFARVNHNKFMVTDNTAYIGTSNWSGDYFTDTAGVGFVLRDNGTSSAENVRTQLLSIFERDWNSTYAHNMTMS